MQYMPTTIPLSPLLLSPPLLSPDLPPTPKKRAGLLEINPNGTKQDTIRQEESPHVETVWGKTTGEKESQECHRHTCSYYKETHKNTKSTASYILRTSEGPCWPYAASFSLHEPMWALLSWFSESCSPSVCHSPDSYNLLDSNCKAARCLSSCLDFPPKAGLLSPITPYIASNQNIWPQQYKWHYKTCKLWDPYTNSQ